MRTLKTIFKRILSPFLCLNDTYTYCPYYYIDDNKRPTFVKTRKIKKLKCFTMKAHDQATADNYAYDYLEDKYPGLSKFVLFK